MAIPIAALLASAARVGVGAAAISGAASVASTFINPLSRELSYQANARGPSIVPCSQALLGLLYSGRLTPDAAQTLLSYLGVTWADDGRLTPTAWARAIDLARPQLDLDIYQKWWRQGRINAAEFSGAMARKGFTVQTGSQLEVGHLLTDVESIPFYLAMQLYLWEMISEADYLRIMQANGFSPDQAAVMYKAAGNVPALGELLTLYNRGALSADETERKLIHAGYVDDEDRSKLLTLAQQIPPPTDIIRFSVREVWDQATIDRFGYDDEFPADFQYWMDRLGLGWNGQLPGQPAPPGGLLSWAKAYWRAHWY